MKNGKGTDRSELPAEFLRQKFLAPHVINFRLRAESGNVSAAQCNKGLWLRRRLVEPATERKGDQPVVAAMRNQYRALYIGEKIQCRILDPGELAHREYRIEFLPL